jgi:hypothetical protein
MLSHLDNALADGLHVTQVAERSLAKSRDQPTLLRLVAQPLQPGIELGQGPDDVQGGSVIVRLHLGKIPMNDEGPWGPFQDIEFVGAGDGNRTHVSRPAPFGGSITYTRRRSRV